MWLGCGDDIFLTLRWAGFLRILITSAAEVDLNPMRAAFPSFFSSAWLVAWRLAGCGGLLMLGASCGRRDVGSAPPREAAKVVTESGPLPTAGAANRLMNEQSAFLRHHAQDPVDWYPWGEEAFIKARTEQKLILVSVGYASCPWSQKMQEQSFRDPATARFMNRHYVNILVDREERPDVNNSYLHFLYWKSKKSGWPLHAWLTPEGLPIFSGVYFPVNSEGDSPSWNLTIEYIANNFADDPAYVKQQAERTAKEYLKEYRKFWRGTESALQPSALGDAFDKLRGVYDPVNGGFSSAPKFPQTQSLNYLMAYAARLGKDRMGRSAEARKMLQTSLDAILKGGIYDHLGGGIHRYSTDIYWVVPQFEKMLYDQGFFAESLVNAGLSLGRRDYFEEARAVLRYADGELGHPEGGFYCAEGSSSPVSEGDATMREGAFYVWQLAEIEKVVGAEALPLLRRAYGLEERGNLPIDSPVRGRFPGANVLRLERSAAEIAQEVGRPETEVQQVLSRARAALLEARRKRPRPLLDDKVLASWNGTMVTALARASWVLQDAALRERAVRAAEFILKRLRRADGTLVHAFLDGPSTAPGYAEDYAQVIRSFLDLYESTAEVRWLQAAADLQDKEIAVLGDPEDGAFFDGPVQPLLFNRMKSIDESTEFAASAVSAQNLIRLGHMLGRKDYLDQVKSMMAAFGSLMQRSPAGFLRMLQAYDGVLQPPLQVMVVGAADAPDRAEMLAAVGQGLPFGRVVLYLDGGEAQAWLAKGNAALRSLESPAGRTTVHFCRNFVSQQSFDKASALGPALEKALAQGSP